MSLTPVDLAVLAVTTVAADNDLYRVCGDIGTPAQFRTLAGNLVDRDAVLWAVASGKLGDFAKPEQAPDGVWVERFDLSDYGLDWHLSATEARSW